MDTEKKIAVCVPWKSDGGHRKALWTYVQAEWRRALPEAEFFMGQVESADGLFRRGWSCNAAVTRAFYELDPDVVVIADADTFMTDWNDVRCAVNQANDAKVLCYAHETRWMLGPLSTTSLLETGTFEADPDTTGPHINTYSGVLAIGRPLWKAMNGFDPRFEGWGFEDLSMFYAASTLGTVERVAGGECWHMWHPRKPEEEEGQPHYLDNWALWQRYMSAQGDLPRMQMLINEAPRWWE